MIRPIAIFYHCLFYRDAEFLPVALDIARAQFEDVEDTGLAAAASEIHVGINGGAESSGPAHLVFPWVTELVFHGLDSKNECSTIRMIEEWSANHPGWYVLYFHCKGATKAAGDPMTTRWRGCMQRHTVSNWRRCVGDLDAGYEAVGCHWMEPPATPEGQYIFAGTFFWAKSDFLRTLPSILARDRIKLSGLKSPESRYEAEVWLGNGPRRPRIKDYHGPGWDPGKWGTCAT